MPFDILINYALGLIVLLLVLWFGIEALVGTRFNDVAASQQCGLFVDSASPDIFTLHVEKLRHDS